MPKTNKEEIRELKKEVNKIKKGRDSEPKMTYYALTSSNITNTGNVTSLFTNITRGTAHSQFIGDDIRVSSVLIRGYIRWNSTDADAGVRLMLVRRTYEEDATPVVMAAADAPENLLTWNATDAQKPLQPMNWHSRKNFKILREMLVYGNSTTLKTLPFKWRIKMNHKVNFNGTPVAETGGLWLMAISDEDTDYPQLTYYARVNFTDK